MHHPFHNPNLHYPLVFLILGLMLLLLGRRLFWLFVAVSGFVAGVEAAPYVLPHQSELFLLIIAIILGLLGALLALFLQKVAIALGGFAAGGYLAIVLCAPLLGGAGTAYPGAWLFFLIGGILGAILLFVFFNWALVILSSFYGAHLILRSLAPPHQYFTMFLIVLALAGIAIQAGTYRRPVPVTAE